MSNNICVSIIIPVFNTDLYLTQCIDSVTSQDLANIEIICVDNGSTDNSISLLNKFAATHQNIKILHHPEGRQGDARNAGLQIACGEYIGFVDSDDFIHPEMFSKLLTLAKSHSGEIAICNIEIFYQQSGTKKQLLTTQLLESEQAFHVSERPWILRNLTICNKLFSASLLKRLNLSFPSGILHEDQFFVATALLNAEKIISTPESLYYYRKEREGSVSSNLGKQALDIFSVMALLDAKTQSAPEMQPLVNELKISRFLQLYVATRGQIRRAYFRKLKNQINYITIPTRFALLTPSEYREFTILRKNGFLLSECFYGLRNIYGMLRP